MSKKEKMEKIIDYMAKELPYIKRDHIIQVLILWLEIQVEGGEV